MDDDITEVAEATFRLVSIAFDEDPIGIACFSFGTADSGGPYKFRAELGEGAPNIEEALAQAAELAAADLRAWAQEAENLAAIARAGRLRQPPATD